MGHQSGRTEASGQPPPQRPRPDQAHQLQDQGHGVAGPEAEAGDSVKWHMVDPSSP